MDYRTSRTIEAYPSGQDTPDAIRLWRHIFGDRQDLIEVFTAFRRPDGRLSMPATKHYTPDQLDEAAAWAAQQDGINREVFFCAHQLLAPERIKGNAAPITCLWADVDGADLAASPIKPTAVVESSPGRMHAYARLDRPIAPAKAEEFNKRWALAFGADGSGFDLTQLLRAPQTRNHKYEDAPTVRLLEIDDETAYDPAELDRILPRLPEPPATQRPAPTTALSEDDAELVGLLLERSRPFADLWRGDTARYADERGNVDDSAADWGLIRDLLRATGLDADRTERLARQSALATTRNGKWDDPRSGRNYLRYSIDRAIERGVDAEQTPARAENPQPDGCTEHCQVHQHEVDKALRAQLSATAALLTDPTYGRSGAQALFFSVVDFFRKLEASEVDDDGWVPLCVAYEAAVHPDVGRDAFVKAFALLSPPRESEKSTREPPSPFERSECSRLAEVTNKTTGEVRTVPVTDLFFRLRNPNTTITTVFRHLVADHHSDKQRAERVQLRRDRLERLRAERAERVQHAAAETVSPEPTVTPEPTAAVPPTQCAVHPTSEVLAVCREGRHVLGRWRTAPALPRASEKSTHANPLRFSVDRTLRVEKIDARPGFAPATVNGAVR